MSALQKSGRTPFEIGCEEIRGDASELKRNCEPTIKNGSPLRASLGVSWKPQRTAPPDGLGPGAARQATRSRSRGYGPPKSVAYDSRRADTCRSEFARSSVIHVSDLYLVQTPRRVPCARRSSWVNRGANPKQHPPGRCTIEAGRAR